MLVVAGEAAGHLPEGAAAVVGFQQEAVLVNGRLVGGHIGRASGFLQRALSILASQQRPLNAGHGQQMVRVEGVCRQTDFTDEGMHQGRVSPACAAVGAANQEQAPDVGVRTNQAVLHEVGVLVVPGQIAGADPQHQGPVRAFQEGVVVVSHPVVGLF